MKWEDERYVRLYTRDTIEWTMLPWQAKALLPLLLRKVDRAGNLDLGEHGVRGLAAIVGLPIEVVGPGLTGLIETGAVVQLGRTIAVPNFRDAQTAVTGLAQRKRDERERKRACDQTAKNVTKRDIESRNVTESHAERDSVTERDQESRNVTFSHAERDTVTACKRPVFDPTSSSFEVAQNLGSEEGSAQYMGEVVGPVTKRDIRSRNVTKSHENCDPVTLYCTVLDQKKTNKGLFGDEASPFLVFWEQYPRKTKKASAEKAFARRVKTRHQLDQVMSALRTYREVIARQRTREEYVLHPATFLNGAWEDYRAADQPQPTAPLSPGSQLDLTPAQRLCAQALAEEERQLQAARDRAGQSGGAPAPTRADAVHCSQEPPQGDFLGGVGQPGGPVAKTHPGRS